MGTRILETAPIKCFYIYILLRGSFTYKKMKQVLIFLILTPMFGIIFEFFGTLFLHILDWKSFS